MDEHDCREMGVLVATFAVWFLAAGVAIVDGHWPWWAWSLMGIMGLVLMGGLINKRALIRDAQRKKREPSALMIAIYRGDEIEAHRLIESDPRCIHQLNAHDESALMKAIQKGASSVAQQMLSSHTLTLVDWSGNSALDYALRSDDVECLQQVVQAHRALITQKPSWSRVRRASREQLQRVLFDATEQGNTQAVQVLLEAGANPKRSNSRSLLVTAVGLDDHASLVRWLLGACHPSLVDATAPEAFELAARQEHWDCVDLLSAWSSPEGWTAAVETAGRHNLPQTMARMERWMLTQATDLTPQEAPRSARAQNASECTPGRARRL